MAPREMGEIWATMGSTLASFMFFWAIIQRYCPHGIRQYFDVYTNSLMRFFDPFIRVSIYEFAGSSLKLHKAYAAVEAYLSEKSSSSAKRLKGDIIKHSNKLAFSMDESETVSDEYCGVKVWWALGKISSPTRSAPMFFYHPEPDRRYYRLTFHRRDRELITDSYLEHVVKTGKEMRSRNRQRKLYTNSHSKTMWSHIVFNHPATFETLAMEPEKKQEIIEDLVTFTRSKDFYSRVGKAWKRGYLLYGPPGTGKSTMIAAMANLLNYDVYDLELTSVKNNMELTKLLIETSSKSIIVIEDIDCSLHLTSQRKKKQDKYSEVDNEKRHKETSQKEQKEESGSKVTLSGLLNFSDGLWSACGGERLIVFTTNYVEKLDPALTRRGRMDKHVELSYCSFEGFKVLARNYLQLEQHPLFKSIQELIQEMKITPADVAENLMPKSPTDDAEKCLLNLIHALEEATKAEAKKEAQVEILEKQNALLQDKPETEIPF